MSESKAIGPTGDHVRYAQCKGCDDYVKRDEMLALNLRFYDHDNRERRIRLRLCPRCWERETKRAHRLAWDNRMFTRAELPEDKRPVENEYDLLRMSGVEDRQDFERRVYSDTSCGPWVEWTEGGIRVGSIVEGVDEFPAPRDLDYPFMPEDLERALADVDEDANRIWLNTHGCEKCWPPGCVFGGSLFWPVNRECAECKGEGVAR